ncbi:hypothetical protein PO909_017425 [Leuciscus waleckii]
MEEWKAMKKMPGLEPGTGTENIAIIEHFQVENSEVVVTLRLTPRKPAEDNMQSKNKGRIMAFFQRSWQAIKQGFTRCLWPNEVPYELL